MVFYEEGRRSGAFEDGIERALRRLLASPQFIVRAEREPADLAPGETYRITDLELASRLSFFLWSSIPDNELIDVASQGRLSDSTVLEQQVRAHARRSPIRESGRKTSRNNGCTCGIWGRLLRLKRSFPTGTTSCGRVSPVRRNCSSKPLCARIATSLKC